MTITEIAIPDPEESPDRRSSRRNVNGEGTIRQRKDGRWEGRVWVFTTDGREVRRSVYGDSWDEAHEKLTHLKAGAMSGVRVAGSNDTVSQYMSYWLTEIVRERVRSTTYSSYEQLIRCYIVPMLGRKKLANLTAPEIRVFLNRAKKICQCCALGKDRRRIERVQSYESTNRKIPKNLTLPRCCALKPPKCCQAFLGDGTIRYLHRLLRAALQDAVVEGLVAQNNARNLRLNHKYRPKFVPWSAKEAKQFLKAARSDRLYALYAVALTLGLRRGEVLGLRWEDLDLTTGVIRVYQGLHRVNGELSFGPVKTSGSERIAALPSSCLQALLAHQTTQAEQRQQAGKSWKEQGLVFTTKFGTPIEPRNINRWFGNLCEEAGVRPIRFHDLRHSCATLLYDQGVRIDKIQDILGHSSPVITKLIYIDVAQKIQRAAADQLDFLFDEEQRE